MHASFIYIYKLHLFTWKFFLSSLCNICLYVLQIMMFYDLRVADNKNLKVLATVFGLHVICEQRNQHSVVTPQCGGMRSSETITKCQMSLYQFISRTLVKDTTTHRRAAEDSVQYLECCVDCQMASLDWLRIHN